MGSYEIRATTPLRITPVSGFRVVGKWKPEGFEHDITTKKISLGDKIIVTKTNTVTKTKVIVTIIYLVTISKHCRDDPKYCHQKRDLSCDDMFKVVTIYAAEVTYHACCCDENMVTK